MKYTKIIATHGPAIKNEDELLALYDRGVNVIRFNFSHAQYAPVSEVVAMIQKNNASGRSQLSTLLDTKGPEIRTGDLSQKQSYSAGDVFKMYISPDDFVEDGKNLFCDYPYLGEDAFEGQLIDVDSGLFQVEVLSIHQNYVEVVAKNDALIGNRRHINLPGIKLKMPGITGKDKQDVAFAVEQNMDFIAQSFVRNADNIRELREYLTELGAPHIKIIAKIENQEGIENIEEIVDAADGIMVARGDLGIEVPIERLPTLQANIVSLTREKGKFVIIATHLLESMIENPFPTRAEVSDIYNSVMQKTDAVMLSGETAAGKYPHKAVSVMRDTILEAEKNVAPKHRDFLADGLIPRDIEKKVLIKSAIYSAEELGVSALFIFTKSGRLARFASSFRPKLPVYAFTPNANSVGYMNILYGVHAYFLSTWDQTFTQNIAEAIEVSKQKGDLQVGDRILVVNDICKGKQEIPVVELMTVE